MDAERDTRGRARCIVTYDEMLRDWQTCARRIGQAAGMEWPRSIEQAKGEIDLLLTEGLRHHRSVPESLKKNENVSVWVR